WVFFFQAEDGIRDRNVAGVQTCALPIFFSERPKKELGRLAVVNLRESIEDKHTVLNKKIEREIALLRNPRMVVEYWRGPRNMSEIGRASCREREKRQGVWTDVKSNKMKR